MTKKYPIPGGSTRDSKWAGGGQTAGVSRSGLWCTPGQCCSSCSAGWAVTLIGLQPGHTVGGGGSRVRNAQPMCTDTTVGERGGSGWQAVLGGRKEPPAGGRTRDPSARPLQWSCCAPNNCNVGTLMGGRGGADRGLALRWAGLGRWSWPPVPVHTYLQASVELRSAFPCLSAWMGEIVQPFVVCFL